MIVGGMLADMRRKFQCVNIFNDREERGSWRQSKAGILTKLGKATRLQQAMIPAPWVFGDQL